MMDESRPEASVILPTFNERESLPRVIEEIHASLGEISHEIVVADDDSPDGTWRWVEEQSALDPALRLLRRTDNPGLSASVLDGFRVAKGEKLFVMDADGQHDPSLLPQMCRSLETHELVVPSRYLADGGTGRWNPVRRLGSRGATWLARLVLNAPLSDPMSGYFGIRREAFGRVASSMNPRGFKVLLELYYRLSRDHGARRVSYQELPYQFRTRLAGSSKLSGRIVWQYLLMLVALRKEAGHWPAALPKFLCVGALGVVVNCVVLWCLVHLAGWHYLAAALVSIQVSILHNFLWHDRWTFKNHPGRGTWFGRLGRYEVGTCAGMAINWLALAVLVSWWHWPIMPANVLGIGAGTVVNFVFSKLWAWHRPLPSVPRPAGRGEA